MPRELTYSQRRFVQIYVSMPIETKIYVESSSNERPSIQHDAMMGTTHIIVGDEWLDNNLPKVFGSISGFKDGI